MTSATLDAPVVTSERPAVRWLLTGVALAFLGLFLVVPLAAVFASALGKGVEVYVASIAEPDALAAIRLRVPGRPGTSRTARDHGTRRGTGPCV